MLAHGPLIDTPHVPGGECGLQEDGGGDEMSTGSDSSGGGALRALIAHGQEMIGCPPWCTWSVTHPEHQHLVYEGAEIVVYPCSEEPGEEAVAEVRHLAAPTPSGGVSLNSR